MKRLALSAALALALAGCANIGGPGSKNIPLAYAPAETAFAFGSLERAPKGYEALNRHWFEMLRAQITPSLERALRVLAESDADPAKLKTAKALLGLLQEKLHAPGTFDNLGIDVNALLALYEVQALPVLRIELADADKFKAFIAEAEARAGEKLSSAEVDGQPYWYLQPETEADAYLKPRLVAAVQGKHLVLTIDPQRPEAPLAQLLGVHKPAQSLIGAGTMQAINKQYEYLPGGITGFVDSQRLVALLGGATGTGAASAAAQPTWLADSLLNYFGMRLDATCQSELQATVSKTPRMVGGAKVLSDKQMHYHMLLEMDAELAKDFSALPAPVPGLGTVRGNYTFGVSANPSAVANLLQKQLQSIQASPYQCQYLAPLNELAADASAIIAMLHAGSSWGHGFRVDFSDLSLLLQNADVQQESDAAKLGGTLLLASANPSAMLGMLQGFMPELGQVGLQPGGPAKQLPDELIEDLGLGNSLWAMVGQRAIGLALGDENKATLETLMQAPAPAVPPFMAIGASGAFYSQLLQSFSEEDLQEFAAWDWETAYYHITWPLMSALRNIYAEVDYMQSQWLMTERGMELTYQIDLLGDPVKK
ncbi:MAG: hypothetical protein Q4A97_05945 [Comamonadaceae bacterium]|nr:hypothetical protein [Comamonadaceae bacterium]